MGIRRPGGGGGHRQPGAGQQPTGGGTRQRGEGPAPDAIARERRDGRNRNNLSGGSSRGGGGGGTRYGGSVGGGSTGGYGASGPSTRVATGGPFSETPYTGPTLQAGSGGPTGAMDITSRGAGENWWKNNRNRLNDPSLSEQNAAGATERLSGLTASEQFANQNRATFSGPTASQGEFASMGQQGATALDQARGAMGDMPNFDAFYDRARERQAGGINDQLAARGGYGSSAGLDQLSQGMSDLNAAQANREADFAMSQVQQTLDAAGMSDTLNMQGQELRLTGAGQADIQQQGMLGLGLDAAGQSDVNLQGQQTGLADILLGSDEANLGRFDAGLRGSTGAQNLKEGRVGLGYDIQSGATRDFLNTLGPSLAAMIGGDAGLFETGLAGEVGVAELAANNARGNRTYESDQQQNRIGTVLKAGEIGASALSPKPE